MSEHKNDGIQSLNVKNMFYILVRFSKKSGKQTKGYSKGICFLFCNLFFCVFEETTYQIIIGLLASLLGTSYLL